jgi:CheY-like chemotaxis protein
VISLPPLNAEERGAWTAVDPRPHILVMDDTEEHLRLLREALEEEGYRVSTSATVVGIEEVKRLRPDLILLDLVFAGEPQGLPFLRQLRVDGEASPVPVVVCSAAVGAVRRMEPDHLGAGGGLVLKPFGLDDLLREVREVGAWGRGRAGSGGSRRPTIARAG